MARQKQLAPTTATAGTTFPAAEAVDIAQLVEDLDAMLTRLRLGAIREQLDALLEEAASNIYFLVYEEETHGECVSDDDLETAA